MTRAERQPGASLLHPLALLALVTVVLNDHVLKHVWPGALSGKLSDFGSVLLLPLVLHAFVELCAVRWRGRRLESATSNRWLVACIALSVVLCGLPEIWKPAEQVYRYGMGALRWPFVAAWSALRHAGLPPLRPVRATADVTDLLALPMCWVSYLLARRDEPQLSAVSHST